jgi:hypothetical protein
MDYVATHLMRGKVLRPMGSLLGTSDCRTSSAFLVVTQGIEERQEEIMKWKSL